MIADAHPVAGLLQGRVRQPDQVHAGQPRGDVGFDLHDLAVQAADGDRERPPSAISRPPCRCVISGVRLRPIRTPTTSMRTAAQLPRCAASHNAASRRSRRTFAGVTASATPPNPSLVRVFTSTNTTVRPLGRPRSHRVRRNGSANCGPGLQPKRAQMFDGQLLTQRTELSTRQILRNIHTQNLTPAMTNAAHRPPTTPRKPAVIHSQPLVHSSQQGERSEHDIRRCARLARSQPTGRSYLPGWHRVLYDPPEPILPATLRTARSV